MLSLGETFWSGWWRWGRGSSFKFFFLDLAAGGLIDTLRYDFGPEVWLGGRQVFYLMGSGRTPFCGSGSAESKEQDGRDVIVAPCFITNGI